MSSSVHLKNLEISLRLREWNCIKISNVYEAMRPFYYWAKFFGFAPFQLKEQQLLSEQRISNTVDWIITLLSFCGYSYILCVLCKFKEEDFNVLDSNMTVTMFKGFLYLITHIMSIISMTSNLIFRKNILKVATDLHQTDKEVIWLIYEFFLY